MANAGLQFAGAALGSVAKHWPISRQLAFSIRRVLGLSAKKLLGQCWFFKRASVVPVESVSMKRSQFEVFKVLPLRPE